MSPTIGYSWTPDFSEDFLGKDLRYVRRRSIENNEEKIFDRFSGTIAGNTPKSEQKSMTFGINNIFQAKVLKAEEEKKYLVKIMNNLIWCPHTDSNREPIDYKSIALPIEL